MKKRWIVIGLGLVAAVGGWAAFRPERLWIDKQVNEALDTGPSAANQAATTAAAMPGILLAGDFHSGAHETTGRAAIYQLADGSRVLRLTGFQTSNGPDVRVLLVAATDATDNQSVQKSGFVDLGALKGNIGDQNYDIPAGVDLASYRSATVWCRRFSVNFGTAPLLPHSS
jgi:hypothetical protein